MATGMVAASAHHNGRYKSQIKPSTTKLAQKILFSIAAILPRVAGESTRWRRERQRIARPRGRHNAGAF